MNNHAIAFGAYLVGLVTRVVAVKATTTTDGQFTIELRNNKGKPPDACDAWSRETRMRVRGSLAACDIDIAGVKITFDHPPTRSSCLDLAVFAACLGVLGKLPVALLNHVFVGEVGPQGHVRPVRGVLPILGERSDERPFVIPFSNAIEASFVEKTNIFAIEHVSELFDLSSHVVMHREYQAPKTNCNFDLERVPTRVMRALAIASSNARPIHLIGSNTLQIARLVCAMLPAMTRDEAIEAASIHAVVGLLRNEGKQIGIRPFRAPDHTISEVGMVGGGDLIRPGEVSLAHNGVLYLDSLPEFKRATLEGLATVLRRGKAVIRRACSSVTFPAQTMLVTGCRVCRCENRNGIHAAYCTADRRKEWQSRYLDTLGIADVIDVDFQDGDEPCRSWSAENE